MAGPAKYQSFFDSSRNSLKKSRTPSIGGMSWSLGVKEEEEDGFLGLRSGSSWSWRTLLSSLVEEISDGWSALLASIAKGLLFLQ